MTDPIDWRQDQTPISKTFNDIYFDVDNGLAESHYVFVDTNEVFEKSSGNLNIGEFGFGTGLNFFATAQRFLSRQSSGRLFYYSCEKYPLSPQAIRKTMSRWPELHEIVEEFLQFYSRLPKGFGTFELANRKIRVSIFFGDAKDFLDELEASIDVWYFDGFAPKKNPEMWAMGICEKVAKLSHQKTSFSSFSSAGFFRRQLSSLGARVQKKRGYGRKREMSFGQFEALPVKEKKTLPQRIAIIGAGMAGTQLAESLNLRMTDYHCFESANEVAHGASGNPIALVMPYLMSKNPERILFSSSAFNYQRSLYSSEFYSASGATHYFFPEEKTRELARNVQKFDWPEELLTQHEDHIQFLMAGVFRAKTYIQSFWQHHRDQISLSKKIAKIEIGSNQIILKDETQKSLGEFDQVFLACSYASIDFLPFLKSLTKRTRGQIAFLEEDFQNSSALSFGHYLSPKVDGLQVFGGTYRHSDFDLDVQTEDFEELEKSFFQFLRQKMRFTKGRSGVRCHSQNNWPILYTENGISCMSGFGSRAFSESGLVAETLVSRLFDEASPISKNWAQSIWRYRT
ncbi:MAG: tRNA (5-methylaminomethyl-2-thiouridine)(34)-methyltransferase MnmD [Bdellovibrionota bacterium]